MDALRKNIAVARGEALAASLLASAAIQTLFAVISNREQVLAGIEAYIDNTLNMSGPVERDPDNEFTTQVRETARFQVMQQLDAIKRMLRDAR
jgi:hypothetical protein